MSNNCNDDTNAPDFILDPAIGTTPCEIDLSTTATVCDLDACCNYFQLLKEGQAKSFLISEGGPFQIEEPSGCTAGLCPPVTGPSPLVSPPTAAGAIDPGILGSLVCVPNLPPGSYWAFARFDVSGLKPGASIEVSYFPDCADINKCYLLSCLHVPCLTVADGSGQPIFSKPQSICQSGGLVVPVSSCSPGFIINAIQGCPQSGETPVTGLIKNLQIMLLRLSNRDLLNCNNDPLLSHCGFNPIG